MFKFLKEKKKDNKGFTLVELVVVIAILAILVGLLAPQYTKYVEKSRKAADVSNLDNLVSAIKVATADEAYSDIIPVTAGADGAIADTKIEIIIDAAKTVVKVGGKAIDATSTDSKEVAVYKALTEYASTEWTYYKIESQKHGIQVKMHQMERAFIKANMRGFINWCSKRFHMIQLHLKIRQVNSF